MGKSKPERPKCANCNNPNHDESHFYEKKLDGYAKHVLDLIALLQKSNIDIPSTCHRPSSSSSFQSYGKDLGKGHALCTTTIPHSSGWVLDLGASHHMTSSQDLFSSFEASPTPHIWMGKNTIMTICGKDSIEIDDATFHGVLCVPYFSSNLLSIYQITHSRKGKIVEIA